MVRATDLLYRALYHGLLSRLPERAAVPLGQWGLRLLPLDRLPIFRRADPRLQTTLGGVRLANPLILSSMYYDTTILRRAMGLGFGAVTTKSITSSPRPGHPQPNLVRIVTAEGPGLVNCNGFHNPGLEAYRRALAALPHRVPLIVSAAGESAEEYVRVVEGLQEFGDLVEINISSPNTRLVYEWSTRPRELKGVLQSVRKATGRRTKKPSFQPRSTPGSASSIAAIRAGWRSRASLSARAGSRARRSSPPPSTMSAASASASARAWTSSPREASTPPIGPSRRSGPAPRPALTSPDSSLGARFWRV